MNEPLARVTFEFGLDELVDLTRRSTRDLPSVRHMRRLTTGLVITFAAVVTPVMLWWLLPELPTGAVILATLTAVLSSGWLNQRASARRTDRAARNVLRKMYGDGRHRCDVELHADRITLHQVSTALTLPWAEVQSVIDDNGDLVITGQRGVAVVRKFAFPDDAARLAFHAQVRELAGR